MHLVEQHRIRRSDPRFASIDQAAFAAKNLYNLANYHVRQSFIHEGTYLSYVEVFRRVKSHEAYTALPRKVSNAILIQLDRNWLSFFAASKAYRANPSQFTGRPRLPNYKDKTKGRFLLVYEKKALGKRLFGTTGKLVPSGLSIGVATKRQWDEIVQVRIVPCTLEYRVEVVYEHIERSAQETGVDPQLVAALDLGVNVLGALTSNKPGFLPRVASGKVLKSINQFFNKQRAQEQTRLAFENSSQNRHISRHLEQVTTKRNRRINAILHTASRRIIDLLVAEGIGTLVIDKNPLWKQAVHLGRKHNQEFVQIPHARFIEMLTYKARLVGIVVVLQEESYTSTASFLDDDPLPTYDSAHPAKYSFSGRRMTRSWYKARDGRVMHADVNGSYNILRKWHQSISSNSDPWQVGRGVAGAAVHPRRLAV